MLQALIGKENDIYLFIQEFFQNARCSSAAEIELQIRVSHGTALQSGGYGIKQQWTFSSDPNLALTVLVSYSKKALVLLHEVIYLGHKIISKCEHCQHNWNQKQILHSEHLLCCAERIRSDAEAFMDCLFVP